MKILFDTNFLILPFSARVDIFDEAERIAGERTEFFVLRASLGELANVKGKDRLPARAAMVYLERNSNRFEFADGTGRTDRQVEEFAKRHPQAAVATNDRALRQRLKKAGARTIVLRGRSHLVFG
jgi:rRNA-processing protein FCF1